MNKTVFFVEKVAVFRVFIFLSNPQSLVAIAPILGSEVTVDDKAWLIELIRSVRVEDAVYLLYPRVFPVSQLEVS